MNTSRAVAFILLSGTALYGQTVEPPKRTVFDSKGQELKKPPAGAPENGKGASYRALDTLSSSTEDMNAIRDSNVRRLTKDGCAPEVSARIADLRSKLPASGGAPDTTGPDGSTLALASNWFKTTGDAKVPATKDKSIDLLDSVLSGKGASEAKETRPSQDVSGLKAELEHLYAACPGARR